VSEPILDVQGLTVRFGGLTAVCEVDLRVESGQVFAVIGPNGAGKTTVFNAVSGIYEPSAGHIRFCGTELRQPFAPRHAVRWGIAGLFVGVLLFLFVSNVNGLWSAVVKENFRDGRFEAPAALSSFEEYAMGRPRVEQRLGAYFVVSNDGKRSLGTATSPEEAAQLLETHRVTEEPVARRIRAWRWAAFIAGVLLGVAAGVATFRQTRRTPAWIASRGMARTFQNIRLFQEMTVLENVLVALDRRPREESKAGLRSSLVGWGVPTVLFALVVTLALATRSQSPVADATFPSLGLLFVAYITAAARRGAFSNAHLEREQEAQRHARELLAFVGLDGKRNTVSGSLPYGEKRRLEIARALATSPKLVLLDEPAAGMNPAEAVGLMSLIRAIRDRGVSVLLIEHHMRVVMGISDRIAVLEHGRKIAEGTPEEIRANARVVEAYLGKDEEDGA